MITHEFFDQKIEQKDINLFKNCVFLYIIGDIINIIAFFNSYSGILSLAFSILNVLFVNVLFYVIFIFHKKYPASLSGTKIIEIIIIYDVIAVISLILNNLVSFPNLGNQILNAQIIEQFNIYFTYHYVFEFISCLLAIFWVLIAIIITKWFNKMFSLRSEHIRLFMISAFVESIGILIQTFSEFSFNTFYISSFKTDVVTETNITDFNGFIQYLIIGSLLILLSIVLEIIAFYMIFKRLNAISRGTYFTRIGPDRARTENPFLSFPATANYAQLYGNSNVQTTLQGTDNPKLHNQSNGVYCVYCGIQLQKEDQFCNNCGKQIFSF